MKTTESDSNYDHLEHMSVIDLLKNMNSEDQTVPLAVAKVLPQIEQLVNVCVEKMKTGGRLFYLGAGTSGRIGILDASECPPTFGIEQGSFCNRFYRDNNRKYMDCESIFLYFTVTELNGCFKCIITCLQ